MKPMRLGQVDCIAHQLSAAAEFAESSVSSRCDASGAAAETWSTGNRETVVDPVISFATRRRFGDDGKGGVRHRRRRRYPVQPQFRNHGNCSGFESGAEILISSKCLQTDLLTF